MDNGDVPDDIRVHPLIFMAQLVADSLDAPPRNMGIFVQIFVWNMPDSLGDDLNRAFHGQADDRVTIEVLKATS